jgi:hypothetical protein
MGQRGYGTIYPPSSVEVFVMQLISVICGKSQSRVTGFFMSNYDYL